MTTYALPEVREHGTTPPATAFLIASGDLRPSANVAGWPTQAGVEESLTRAFADLGWTLHRANPVDPEKGHGFIDSQRMGLTVFASIPPDAPLVVAEA
ncbi:MAG: fucose isomerase, partial [Pseudonocardia sp.]|nr:fucose isomerase [Pseudonocardia sp.]